MKKWSEIWADIRNNEDFSDLNRGLLKDVLNGNFLRRDFMRRQTMLFVLIATLAIVYIDNRYRCEKQQARITQLQNELRDTGYEALTVSSELTKMIRRSHVLDLLQNSGLELEENTDPPILID